MNDIRRTRTFSRWGLVFWVALSFIAGWIGSIPSKGAWYDHHLEKPLWTAPDWIFAPVWTMLYLFIGLAAWQIWKKRRVKNIRKAILWFTIQLLLNALWPWLFFGLQDPGLALVGVLALWIAIFITVDEFRRLDHRGALLLLPYLIWCSYALILNAVIWHLN